MFKFKFISASRCGIFPGAHLPVSKKREDNLDERREEVKNSMKNAWESYKNYAFGKDELTSVKKRLE
ncbi:hypothetical protein AYI70_g8706 [Smittium culicis]|uniref:Uncharacterized protein n=1 Tax=Smittium culicis TaxID=133412 RepID=A0A1R1XEQ3_9FUNG|nr:hypothetical protein AYI70_g9392 [Smittium culicis]OMJ13104.1 hypothetical protein AYI70_g8706 [Smittium culicis]